MSTTITRDDWLNAIREAGIDDPVGDPDAVTAGEFAAMFGIDRNAAMRRLVQLVEAGKATRTTKRMTDVLGRSVSYPAYKLIQEPPKQAKQSKRKS